MIVEADVAMVDVGEKSSVAASNAVEEPMTSRIDVTMAEPKERLLEAIELEVVVGTFPLLILIHSSRQRRTFRGL